MPRVLDSDSTAGPLLRAPKRRLAFEATSKLKQVHYVRGRFAVQCH